MAKGKQKGGSFERDICKQLSLWWTNKERDDIFWRSANSGARATVRSRSGVTTFGQYGDVQATDPIGQPLIDLSCIELKRGYSRFTFADVLDAPTKAKLQRWELFIQQVVADRKKSKTPFWILISRRDRREALIFIPMSFFFSLNENGAHLHLARPWATITSEPQRLCPEARRVFICPLSEFVRLVSPKDIITLARSKQCHI